MARVLDIGGTLVENDILLPPDQADYLALQSDWQAIGDDMRAVMPFK